MGYCLDNHNFTSIKTFHPDLILKLAAKIHLFFYKYNMLKKNFKYFIFKHFTS